MASLDHLQNEADKILKLTMQRVASNELDEGVIKGFALALDQARFAVADRRAVLLGLRTSPDHATESDAAVHELKPALERRAGS
jgi:DNA-binding Lrp family transcriptional regulator